MNTLVPNIAIEIKIYTTTMYVRTNVYPVYRENTASNMSFGRLDVVAVIFCPPSRINCRAETKETSGGGRGDF